MADILIDNETIPSTPAASKSLLFVDSTTKKFAQMDDAGTVRGLLGRNFTVISSGAGFAADTYVAGSGILLPSFNLQVGALFRWTMIGSKTAAGVATPTFIFRLGTGVIGDTALLTLTGVAQTAAVDNGMFIFELFIKTAGVSGAVYGQMALIHSAANAVGFGSTELDALSGTVDLSTSAGKTLGISINGGASAAWTLTTVHGEMIS